MGRTRRLFTRFTPVLFAAVLSGCGSDPGDSNPGIASGTVGTTISLPAPTSDKPIDARHLPNDIYKAVCRLGSPVLVHGSPADSASRTLYFAGPFSQGNGAGHWEYLSLSIEGPERRWVSEIRRMDHSQLKVGTPRPQELERFKLRRIEEIRPNIHLVRQDLGDPVLIRDIQGGQQRYIFDRKFCMGEQLLEGMYLDVERERVVKARGIEHPNELAWILSGGRPPGPDPEPVRYLDVRPADGSPQSVALAFVRRREMQDPESARSLVWEESLLSGNLASMLDPTRPGARLDDHALSYQTSLYGHDETHVSIRYQVYTGPEDSVPVEDWLVLRKRAEEWKVVASSRRP
jgi:hypothetical protein